jgi:hypothetical protein
MPLISTHELTGSALDWAVAKAEGLLEPQEYFGKMLPPVVIDLEFLVDGPIVRLNPTPQVYYDPKYSPSTRWDQGGPLIEHHIFILEDTDGGSGDTERWMAQGGNSVVQYGPTPLVAACRCLVFHKLGTQVDIPQELL